MAIPRARGGFPDSGFLMQVKERRSEKSPEFTGDISLSKSLVDYIAHNLQPDGSCNLRLAAWKKMSKAGNPFMSIKISMPFEPKTSPRRQADMADVIMDLQNRGKRGGRDDDPF
jgi:hypothetical protein